MYPPSSHPAAQPMLSVPPPGVAAARRGVSTPDKLLAGGVGVLLLLVPVLASGVAPRPKLPPADSSRSCIQRRCSTSVMCMNSAPMLPV